MQGHDNWDPMGIKEIVMAAEKESGQKLNNIPIQLKINTSCNTIETGKDTLLLVPTFVKFGNYKTEQEEVTWSINTELESIVNLHVNADGTCRVIPINENDETREVLITAKTRSGLEAASLIYISPSFLDAPAFISYPEISKNNNGKLKVNYSLDMKFADQSLITWYRCSDSEGSNPIEVAVSRFNKPTYEYELSEGDLGYYIMATVSAKHVRCLPGKPNTAIYKPVIKTEDLLTKGLILEPDLETLSTKLQTEVKPGFWTLDCYKPTDTNEYNWEADNSKDSWYYGPGIYGAANDTGLVQATKGARLRYTPIGNNYSDMKISFTAVPAKTAGQGFSSAMAQYMDVFIKFDNKKLNGYALRLIRTTKYHDAIDFILMEYNDGVGKEITKPISASCYRPNCQLEIEVKANKLIVKAFNVYEYYSDPEQTAVLNEVNIETEITPNKFGGFGFQHTGTTGSGATLIKNLKIEWKK